VFFKHVDRYLPQELPVLQEPELGQRLQEAQLPDEGDETGVVPDRYQLEDLITVHPEARIEDR